MKKKTTTLTASDSQLDSAMRALLGAQVPYDKEPVPFKVAVGVTRDDEEILTAHWCSACVEVEEEFTSPHSPNFILEKSEAQLPINDCQIEDIPIEAGFVLFRGKVSINGTIKLEHMDPIGYIELDYNDELLWSSDGFIDYARCADESIDHLFMQEGIIATA